MKRILLMILICVIFISCGSKQKIEIEKLDFGTEKFDEPFRYLPSKPLFLVKSLEYTPNWFLSDTIYLSKVLALEFNEESTRSKSEIVLIVGDSLGNSLPGVNVYFNNILAIDNQVKVSAQLGVKQDLVVSLKLLPEYGEQSFEGGIFVVSDEVDEVNGANASNTVVKFAEWKAEQEIGGTWLLWIVWVLIVVVLVFGVLRLLTGIISLLGWLLYLLSHLALVIQGVGGGIIVLNKINFFKKSIELVKTRSYKRKEIDKVFKKVKEEMHKNAKQKDDEKTLFIDCYTGKIIKGGDRYDYEHIRSAEEIFMKYRDRLTNEQIAEVVNCPDNVKVTLRTINQSKGKRTFEEWCTKAQVEKYDIDLSYAQESVRKADLGIERVAKRYL